MLMLKQDSAGSKMLQFFLCHSFASFLQVNSAPFSKQISLLCQKKKKEHFYGQIIQFRSVDPITKPFIAKFFNLNLNILKRSNRSDISLIKSPESLPRKQNSSFPACQNFQKGPLLTPINMTPFRFHWMGQILAP